MRIALIGCFVLLLALFVGPITAFCNDQSTVDSTASNLPGIYIDCSGCDHDYFRQEILMADFVRDRKQADIHIFVTRQYTGSGGREYKLEFIGRNEFAGLNDTLQTTFTDSDTDDKIRQDLTAVIRMGLVRFLARTPEAVNLSVSFNRSKDEAAEVVDRWNYWVFSADLNGWLRGQKTYHNINLYGNMSAKRTTEDLKLNIRVWGDYSEDRYENDDGDDLFISRGRGANASSYFSINDHWSWGVYGSVWTSTYSNKKSHGSGALGLEYNIYPYAESSRRQLTFQTYLQRHYVDYDEETIYNKHNEWLTQHNNEIELELVQPWGSIETSLWGNYYLHDPKLFGLGLWGGVEVRLVEGLSMRYNGNISRIRNQIALPKGSISDAEALLRVREQATSYRYGLSFGLSYSFGSRYNNVVNTRF